MQGLQIERHGDQLMIGENPKLIVNLVTQENFIKMGHQMLPYRKRIELSEDLLAGKRENVFTTAVSYYYRQACKVAEGMIAARKYRTTANTTVREIR